MSTLFTRIIQQEIPSYSVYEDEHLYAFLDINPLQLGHTLVVPKKETGNMLDLDDVLYTHLMLVAKNIIAPALQRATGCVRVGYVIEGFGMPDHSHLHLIPLSKMGDLDSSNSHKEADEDMSKIAERIRSEIGQ